MRAAAFILFVPVAALAATAGPAPPPPISSQVDAATIQLAVEKNQVISFAEILDAPAPAPVAAKAPKPGASPVPPMRQFLYKTILLVKAPLPKVRKALLDFSIYSKSNPYLTRSEYVKKDKTLYIEGAVWKFKLETAVRIEERGERWIHFEMAPGYTPDGGGDVLLEPKGDGATLVWFSGQALNPWWPPAFLMTRASKLVMSLTAEKIRGSIESSK